jgi:heme exporter protein D
MTTARACPVAVGRQDGKTGQDMEALPLAFTTGWASGLNAYACVLLLGLLGRFAGVEDVPDSLTRTDVLVVAAVLFVVEFVADKIPYVDSAWDTISTIIRPTVGAVIAALLASDSTTLQQAVIAATGGLAALTSHLVKASLRLAVNTSPEPVTNIAVSSGEDVAVASVVSLAVFYPWLAAGIAAVLLVFGVVLAFLAIRTIRRGLARYREWRENRRSSATGGRTA